MTQLQTTREDASPGSRDREGIEEWLVEDLHDMVAQPLWYLAVELSALRQGLAPDLGRLEERLEVLEEAAQEAYEQLRLALGWAKNPHRPSRTLFQVVQHQVHSFEKQSGVKVSLAIQGKELPVPPWKAHHLAAVLHEALWNACRHGKSQRVEVELTARERVVILKVVDRGAGFVTGTSLEGHYGLATMEKRTQTMGGELKVASRPGYGTQIVVVIPLEEQLPTLEKRCCDGESDTDSGRPHAGQASPVPALDR